MDYDDTISSDWPAFPSDALKAAPAKGTFEFEPQAGTTIGRYKLLQKLGTGGFGVVWMASQREPVVRKVALKIIKLGMDTEQVVARFEAERQALAMMDHPNIAHVFDGGSTETGRPYFVMELVKGIPITEFCNEQKVGTRERLELFVNVCQAVQHAHQKGVIHRDLKPSNILVSTDEDRAVVKVIDFGVAKATQQELTDKTLFTRLDQVIGTPAYMSPEQAHPGAADIDTRSDVYALGVLLYELLTGETPIDSNSLTEGGIDELRRRIREDDPQKPSTRISRLGSDRLAALARFHETEPKKLRLVFRGELDWIVMKALEKDRRRRYETAAGLEGDVRRYLNDEEVSAGAPGLGYRVVRVARRHKAFFLASSAVATILILATIISSTWAYRATRSEEESRHQEGKSWLRSSRLMVEQKRFLSAKMMAKKAIPGLREGSAEGMEATGILSRQFDFPALWSRSQVEAFPGHTGLVVCLDFALDGSRLVTGSFDGTIRRWDPSGRDGEPFGNVIAEEHGFVRDVALSPDGARVLSVAQDGSIQLRDITNGNLLRSFKAANGAVAFHPTDNTIAAPGNDYSVLVWDLNNDGDTPIAVLKNDGHRNIVNDLAFSPNGRDLVSGSRDGTVRIWRLGENGARPVKTFTLDNDVVWAVTVSPDGSTLAAATSRGAFLWNLFSNSKRPHALVGHTGEVTDIDFSPDGEFAATSGMDETIRIWEATTGSIHAILEGHSDEATGVAFGPDGTTLASCSKDHTVKLWHVAPYEVAVRGETTDISDIHYGPGGRFLVAMIDDQTVGFFDPRTGRQQRQFFHLHDVMATAISNDGEHLACSSKDELIYLWNLKSGEPSQFEGKSRNVTCLDFNADSTLMASGQENGDIRIWDTRTKEQLATQSFPGQAIAAIEFDPTGEFIAAATDSQPFSILFLNVSNPLEPSKVSESSGHIAPIIDISYHPTDDLMASAGEDHLVRLWARHGEDWIPQSELHFDGVVHSVQFSMDGNLLAAGDEHGKLTLFESSDRFQKARKVLKSLSVPIASIAFHPDRKELAARSSRGTVRIWPLGSLYDEGHLQLAMENSEVGGLSVNYSRYQKHPSDSASMTSRNVLQLQGEDPFWRFCNARNWTSALKHLHETNGEISSIKQRQLVRLLSSAATRITQNNPEAPEAREEGNRLLELAFDVSSEISIDPWKARASILFDQGDIAGAFETITEGLAAVGESNDVDRRREMFECTNWYFNFGLNLQDVDKARIGLDSIVKYSELPPDFSLADLVGIYSKLIVDQLEADEGSDDQILKLRACTFIEVFARASKTKQVNPGSIRALQALVKARQDFGMDSAATLIERSSDWKYLRADAGSGSWTELAYDDNSWQEGKAPLGFGGVGVRDKEVFVTNLSGVSDRWTYYFRRTFQSEEQDSSGSLVFSVQRDDGLIVYLNGEMVLSDNMPSSEVSDSTPSIRAINADEEEEPVTMILEASLLKPGRNVIAAEVHQASLNSSDVLFDLSAIVQSSLDISLIVGLSEAEIQATLTLALDLLPASVADAWSEQMHTAFLAISSDTQQSDESKFAALCERIWSLSQANDVQ